MLAVDGRGRTPKVLLLALSDDYWTPFVLAFGRLLSEHGIEYVVASDSRAGEYQSFGRRLGAELGTVYYLSDFLRDHRRNAAPPAGNSVGSHAMFSDYFRLRVLGARRRIEGVDWLRLGDSMADFFRMVMERENVAVIVHDQVSTSFSYVCYEVAKARGVHYLGLVGACTPSRYEIRESIYQEHEKVERIRQRILDGSVPLTAEEEQWALAYFKTFDEQEPSYMKDKDNILNDARWQRHVNWPKLRSFLRKCWYQIREPGEVACCTFREPPVTASLRNLTLNLSRLYHKWRFHAFVSPVSDEWMRDNRFVIYPIHVQPEASTSVGSPHFANQLDVIRNIAFCLPPDLQLVVKEHRSAIGFNSSSFYRDIAALPGVRLVGPDTSIKQLIRHSDGVVSLTSTAAFEALLLGRPAWLLGSTPFQCHPLCQTIESFQQLSGALRQRPLIRPTHDTAFLVAYRRYTRPGALRYSEPCWGIGEDLLQAVQERLATVGHARTAVAPVLSPAREASGTGQP